LSAIESRLQEFSNWAPLSFSDLSIGSFDNLANDPPAQIGQPAFERASGGDKPLMIAERDPLAQMLSDLAVPRPKQS
jgi:hypothetical protein